MRHRWLALTVIGLAQLMVVLDATIVNIALPSAQRALGFNNDGRQWVITAYSLAFGSLLLLGGRLADLFGRRTTFVIGLLGFAGASALGGTAGSFTVLIVARALQGMFGSVLAPSALSLLTTTFTDPRERSRAFGVFGAIAGSGGAIGLLLGGVLTEHLDWRWTLYVNVVIAIIAVIGAFAFLHRRVPTERPTLDLLGTLLAAGGLFCLVFGFSQAQTKSWGNPSCWAFLIASGVLLLCFALWERRARHPLLPLRILADRNRSGAFVSVFLSGAGMFGVFLFLTYYLQGTLHYSPIKTGLAFLPMVGMLMVTAQLSTNILVRFVGPKPVVPVGMGLAGGGLVWLTQLGLHSSYVPHVLGPLLMLGFGLGLVMPTAMSLATLGVVVRDQGVASATVNTMQQVGGSIGTALFNTEATDAAADYAKKHVRMPNVMAHANVHSYATGYQWAAAFFGAGLLITAVLYRWGRPEQLASGATTTPESDEPGEDAEQHAAGTGGEGEAAGDTGAPARVLAADASAEPPGSGYGGGEYGAGATAWSAHAAAAGPGVRGRVLGDDGAPVPQAAVTLIDPSGQQLSRATSGADGGYALDAPAGGGYVLVGSAPGHDPRVATLMVENAPVDFDLVLAAAGGLAGTVRSGGTGLAGALVVATDQYGEVAESATSGPDGGYRLSALMPGSYTVTVSAPGHQPTAEQVLVSGSAPTRHDADLGYAATVRGTIRGPGGAPLADARVALLDAAGNVARQHLTGEDGAYGFTDLAGGEYTVVASGYPPATVGIRVSGTGREGIDLTLSQDDSGSATGSWGPLGAGGPAGRGGGDAGPAGRPGDEAEAGGGESDSGRGPGAAPAGG